jgi:hypothetical protein
VKLRIAILALALPSMSAISLLAQGPAAALQPSPENKRLSAFLGTWKDEAEMKPGPFGPGGKMSLTETCDWFAGGFSLVCHTDSTGFMGNIKTLTVLNYDAVEKAYTLFELNSVGHTNSAKGILEADTWTFTGESRIGGKLIKNRTTIKMTAPDIAQMKTEVSIDEGPWTLVMELKGTRVKQSTSRFKSSNDGARPSGSRGDGQ